MENVVIIGSGIAGLTAAIYTARADLKPLVLTGKEDGGQLMLTTDIENFPGFPEGVKGPELIEKLKKQAEKFGARIEYKSATSFKKEGKDYAIGTSDGEITSRTVIICSGASAKWLGLPSEQEYKARGVHTCATCDGYFYKGKEVIVVGGGDAAMEESLFLTKHASKVTIVHRRDEFRASKIMQERALKNEKISVVWDSVVKEIRGNGKHVTSTVLKNVKTGELREMKVDAVFLAIGHIPNTKFLVGKLDLDENGFIKTDGVRTSLPGVFAGGDVMDPMYKQAVTAAGTGCAAALEAEKYLQEKDI